jgi:hypothetical protein
MKQVRDGLTFSHVAKIPPPYPAYVSVANLQILFNIFRAEWPKILAAE